MRCDVMRITSHRIASHRIASNSWQTRYIPVCSAGQGVGCGSHHMQSRSVADASAARQKHLSDTCNTQETKQKQRNTQQRNATQQAWRGNAARTSGPQHLKFDLQ